MHQDVVPSDLTPEEQALLDDVRQMFQQDDISVMMARVQMEGEDDLGLKIERDYLNDVLKNGLGHLELLRVDPPRTEETAFDGSVSEWSLPLKWQLIIHHPVEGSETSFSHSIALSEHEGRLVSISEIARGE